MSVSQRSKAEAGDTGELHTNGNGNGHPISSTRLLSDKSTVLLDSIPSGIVYVDKDQLFQYANKAFEKLFDVDAKELMGKSVAGFLGVAANQAVKKYRELVLAGQPAHFEMEVPFRDSTRFIEATYTPDWDADGKVAGYVLVINDTSDRTDAVKALEESERKNKEIVESLPVALYTCDKNGNIILSNKAADDLWGRKPDCNKDKWCGSWKIFEPDGITEVPLDTCPMAMTVKTGKSIYGKEIVIERPDGTRRHVQPYPTPLFDLNSRVAGAVNMLLDITERKISEKQSAQLAAIVHSSHDPIISKTLDGIITSWNEAAERVFGYTAEEMIGQHVTKLIPPERLNEVPQILERLKKGENVEHFETERISKDKRKLDISLTISPIKDVSGKIIGASKIAKDITEQKKLFEALRESEERFRMAIESTRLGTWEYLPLSGKLKWSGECRKIYEVPDNIEIGYDLFAKLIHPEDTGWVQEKIDEAMDPAGNGKYDIKYRILRYTDKQPRWIRAQGQVYFNEKGEPERFIGTVLDISEEMKFEMALKENVELFTTMVDNVPAMIWMSGEDKFNDYFNKTWLAFTGRTAEQESKEGWLQNVHPDDVQKCIEGYRKALNEQKGFYTEYRLRHNSGNYRWIADNSVARYAPDGSFAGFVSACMDIDDQKNYREKILKSELLLKTISNAAPVGLWMTDDHARNTFVNDTWVEWSGIPCENQQGSGWLDCVHEEDKTATTQKLAECLLHKEKYSTEFRIIGPGGEVRWCFTEGSPYYNVDGVFAGYAGSVTDITDMKRIEERKDDFIKMASHELKTPITSIKGYVQLLMNIYEEMNEEKFQAARGTVKSSLHTIANQVTKLTRLVTELLDLSRIESGKLELHKTTFDLSGLLEETAEDVRLTTSKHAIIVHNDFEGNIYADKDRIGQVLSNLLTNAIKYSPDSDCVEIFAMQRKNNAIIKVRDKGIGIDKKDHEKIFQRFYRVEGRSEQTYPGFGIGLFISNEIVQRHNGIIFVQSEKGKGSEFTVELPIGI